MLGLFSAPKTTTKKTITWQDLNEAISIEELLAEFLVLDKGLIKHDATGNIDESAATRKKYTNDNNGVPARVLAFLNSLAFAICTDKVEVLPECYLGLTDIFVLLSNHLDQQTNANVNPKPADADKKAMVLGFLKAALKLNPAIDYDRLENYSVRVLSSHAQLLFYLGKALFYENAPHEQRLAMLNNAVKIDEYLNSAGVSAQMRIEEDIHGFEHRNNTFKLGICHILRNMGRFIEAIQVIKPQCSSTSQFHRVLAATHLAEIFFDMHCHRKKMSLESKHDAREAAKKSNLDPELADGWTYIDTARNYADNAVNESKALKLPIKYNALVILMKLKKHTEDEDGALTTAQSIIDDHIEDEACGARDAHLIAAYDILKNIDENPRTCTFRV